MYITKFCISFIVLCAWVILSQAASWSDLCPSLLDYQVRNESFLENDFVPAYEAEMHGFNYYCPQTECAVPKHRLACTLAMGRAGVEKVDVAHAFSKIPFEPPQGARRFSTTPEGTPVRLAYILMVHKDIDQVTRLLSAIYHPNHTYLIYIDGRSADLKRDMDLYLSKNPFPANNVIISRYAFSGWWGSPELVYGAMSSMFQLLDAADWDFVINLSGADYPTCSNNELVSYLSTRRGKNFDIATVPVFRTEGYDRPRLTAFFCEGLAENVCYGGRWREFENGLVNYQGSQWFVYSRDFVEYMRTAELPRQLLVQYEFAYVADEGYFGTLLMNSPFNVTRIPNNLRLIVFPPGEYHPKVWSSKEDFDLLKHYTDSCFARKVESGAAILDDIDMYRQQSKQLTLP